MKTKELFISGTKFVNLQDITFRAVDAISGEELQKCLLDGFKIKGNYIILPKGTIMIYDRKSKENDSIDFVNIGKNNYGLAYLEEKELLKINCLQN